MISKRDLAALLLLVVATTSALASTPKLKITLKNDSPLEQKKKDQIERLAAQYDLKKYTITKDIIIEQGVRPHSSPVLTLNGRFLDDDDLALSVYIHEQGHWVLMTRHRQDLPDLFKRLQMIAPGLPVDYPQGAGEVRDTYFHLLVIMMEWQGMEELVGPERARKVMDFMKTDHYTAIYPAVIEHRADIEKLMKSYEVKF